MTSDILQLPGWAWRNVVGADSDELVAIGEERQLDQYVLEDLLDVEQLPKVEEIGDSVFVVLHALRGRGELLDTVDVYFVVTEHDMLTVSGERVPAVDHVWGLLERDPNLGTTPMEVIARLLDVIAQRFLAAAAAIERVAGDLQAQAIVGDATVLPFIQTLRNEETEVRRILAPQVAAATILASVAPVAGNRQVERRIRDAASSTQRASDEFVYARSLLGDVLELYRGAIAEKTNEVSRVLTVYAAIMLPLGIVVGFWGMNFRDLPWLRGERAWWAVVLLMVGISVASWFLFRRRGYIGGPSLQDMPKLLGRGVVNAARAPTRLSRSSNDR